MAITTAAGIAFNTVTNESAGGADDASQLAPLGFQLVVPTVDDGDQIWTYVKANGQLNPGTICQYINGAAQAEVQPTGVALVPKAGIVGVAQHQIGDNGFGFILTKGRGIITAGNGAVIGADRAVTSGGAVTTGRGLDFAAGTTAPGCIIAWCSVAAAGVNLPATCWIDCGGT